MRVMISRVSIIRKVDLFSVMKCFRRHEIINFPSWKSFLRHEIHNPSWNVFISRHGFFYSVMNSNSRHEKNSPSWITYDGMKCIIFRHEILYPPSWIGTIRHESNFLVRNEFKLPSWNFFCVMKSTIRHETSLFPVMDFFYSVMKSIIFPSWNFPSWNPLFRHEIHYFSVMKFCSLRHDFAHFVMSLFLVRHKIKLSSWKNSPSWITHGVMKSIFSRHESLFPPSWIGTIHHESIVSNNHESFSLMHPSCTRSLIKHYTRVHRHNTKAYRDFHCLFSLVYKRNSFLYSASSHPWA